MITKYLLVFIISLLILASLAFFGSVVFFPNWRLLSNWQIQLTKIVIAGGLLIISETFLIWLVNKVLNLEQIDEWLTYVLGNKKKNIKEKIDNFTDNQIMKVKNQRKYIPSIFIENVETKEKLRYFSEPKLFIEKVASSIEKKFERSYFIESLRNIYYPINEDVLIDVDKANFKQKVSELLSSLSSFENLLDVYVEDGVGIKKGHLNKIPKDKRHIYHYHKSNFQFRQSAQFIVDQAREDISLLTNDAVIITSRAGYGKTNCVCDFTENFLRKKNKLSIFFNGSDFNYMSENETVEEVISRNIFPENQYSFTDLLSLVKFSNKIDYLFIIIDGINEHKDLTLFSSALGQFIQRWNSQELKIIITCRVEYFDERFGHLRFLDNISIIKLDDRNNKIPDSHQDYLIQSYFDSFHINLSIHDISNSVRDVFCNDKLMLRFFCEAYEGVDDLEYISDIYRFDVFRRYFQKKIDYFDGLKECLDEIISNMVSQNKFSDIHIGSLSPETGQFLSDTLYENVIVKKDLINIPDVALGKIEVINFVYDEFREYLLASYLVRIWNENKIRATEKITQLIVPSNFIAEGLLKYLFIWAINNQDQRLLNLISRLSQYEEVLIQNIKEIPDKDIPEMMLESLTEVFWADASYCGDIIFQISYRFNSDRFEILTVDFLIDQISKMNEEEYVSLIQKGMLQMIDYSNTYIEFICLGYINLFDNYDLNIDSRHNVLKYLLCLLGVDKNNKSYPDNYLGNTPVIEAIYHIQDNFSESELSSIFYQASQKLNIQKISDNIYELTESIGVKNEND